MGRASRYSASRPIPIQRRSCSPSPNAVSPANACRALRVSRLTSDVSPLDVPSIPAVTRPSTCAGRASPRRYLRWPRAGRCAAGYGSRTMTEALLEVCDLVKHFPVTRGVLRGKQIGTVKAVDGLSFTIQAGETFAIVGESGCGKTTLANLILGLFTPTRGDILLRGQPIARLSPEALMAYRKSVTAVFQDPYGALNPRMRIGDIVTEPLDIHGYPRHIRRQRLHEVLRAVGLSPESARRFPHEFSGGQRQRIGIARALVLQSPLIVLDEPVSSLDVSIRSQILNLLKDLQDELGISYLLISHDLATVEHMSDWIGVMYLGKLIEFGSAKSI